MIKFHKDGTQPIDGEIFVFGSNLAGRHGAGAALAAVKWYGAQYGKGIGACGNSYAIPTKDWKLLTLPLTTISNSIQKFINYAKAHPNKQFFITRIGCGLAGYNDREIAPLFIGFPDNCNFPEQWKIYL